MLKPSDSARLNHMRHIPMALRALAHQQQIALAHHAREVGDDRGIAAPTTPDVGQQKIFLISEGMAFHSLAAGSVKLGMDSTVMGKS